MAAPVLVLLDPPMAWLPVKALPVTTRIPLSAFAMPPLKATEGAGSCAVFWGPAVGLVAVDVLVRGGDGGVVDVEAAAGGEAAGAAVTADGLVADEAAVRDDGGRSGVVVDAAGPGVGV